MEMGKSVKTGGGGGGNGGGGCRDQHQSQRAHTLVYRVTLVEAAGMTAYCSDVLATGTRDPKIDRCGGCEVRARRVPCCWCGA